MVSHSLESSRNVVKRETGANPVQTRCCKLPPKSLDNTQIHCFASSQGLALTRKSVDKDCIQIFAGWLRKTGRAFQRWSKSEDLPELMNFDAFGEIEQRNVSEQ